MYSRLGFRQGQRFNSSVGEENEQNPSEEPTENHICISCINPVKYIGASKPPTYMFVDSDGVVREKINMTQKKQNQRFQPIQYSFEQPDDQSLDRSQEQSLMNERSQEQSYEDNRKSDMISVAELEKEVEKEVEKRLKARLEEFRSQADDRSPMKDQTQAKSPMNNRPQNPRIQSPAEEDIIASISTPRDLSIESLDLSVETTEIKDTTQHEKRKGPNGTFVPYFNDELYATSECSSELRSDPETTLNLVVELAGLLDDEPVIYPFGLYKIRSGEIGAFKDQILSLTWTNDDSHGKAEGRLCENSEQVHVIVLPRIWDASGKKISFSEIELPAIFQYRGRI